MGIQNGLPKFKEKRYSFTQADLDFAKINNPFILKGTDPKFIEIGSNDKLIVFLEYVQHGGSLVIKDKNGVAISDTITEILEIDHSPLRMEGGIELTGIIKFAKGYYIQK